MENRIYPKELLPLRATRRIMHAISTQIQASKALHFNKWSRKAYASFVSINRVVTINQLSSNITERLLQKATSLSLFVSDGFTGYAIEDDFPSLSDSDGLDLFTITNDLIICDLTFSADPANPVYIYN